MRDYKWEIASWIFIIALILSMLLIFVIKLWIVLIINFCGNVIYRALFRKSPMKKSKWFLQFLTVCFLSIGIMLLIMFFPDKICGGVFQHLSDIKFVKKNFGTEYLIRDPNVYDGYSPNAYCGVYMEKVISRYHIDMGIMMTILLVHYIVFAILFFGYGWEKKLYSFTIALPLVGLGTLIIFDIPMCFEFWSKIFRGIISAAYIAVIEVDHFGGVTHFFDRNSGSGGSNSEEYDVIIIKH